MTAEHDYFQDPRIGKLLDLILQLSTDLHVTAQRVHALEAVLVRHGALKGGELDAFAPDAAEQRVLDGQRDAMLGRLIAILAEAGPAEHPLRDQWEALLAGRPG
ncbi:hypothetical protein [Streptomyces radicis]|uniref:Uncharacterized protein n=1 Tax=Streptomyces radicis TaxID=1750517 RepID=A0A3A9WHG6_9ACTN|nr:hypothetical protein [Streptomyces radicis]RKN12468.1 hypothetical protein D7319_00415 [Streptomyces radicis]RKN27764.1 hypothetical protein D7318_02475 [Streptomyces radicis]